MMTREVIESGKSVVEYEENNSFDYFTKKELKYVSFSVDHLEV